MRACESNSHLVCLKSALQATLPIFFAYFPLSLLFGVLFVHEGFNWYFAPLMSLFLFAGAVQFLVLTMLANHAMMISILIASFFVAFRNSFYGLGFIQRFQHLSPWLRAFFAFGMVDATYAILISRPKASVLFSIYTTILIYLYWQLGTVIGAVFADHIPDMAGANFILAAFFMILVIDFYMIHKSILPIVMPILFSIVAYLIMPSFYLVIAICFSLLFICAKHLIETKVKACQ